MCISGDIRIFEGHRPSSKMVHGVGRIDLATVARSRQLHAGRAQHKVVGPARNSLVRVLRKTMPNRVDSRARMGLSVRPLLSENRLGLINSVDFHAIPRDFLRFRLANGLHYGRRSRCHLNVLEPVPEICTGR